MDQPILRVCRVQVGGGRPRDYQTRYEPRRGWMILIPGTPNWYAPPRPMTSWKEVERSCRDHYVRLARSKAAAVSLAQAFAADTGRLASEARDLVLANGGRLPEYLTAEQHPYALNVIRALRSAERDVRLARETLASGRELTEQERRLLQLRVEHPHLSLKELGQVAGATKDAVNGQLRRVFGPARQQDPKPLCAAA